MAQAEKGSLTMQQITISGWLSKDAEQQQTQGGQNVTRWNIPVKQGWGDREQTNWYRVSIWGKRADFAANARKGDFAAVTGELTIGEYNGKPQYEINASDFQSVKMGPKEDAPAREPTGATRERNTYDDSIPF
jgi:single-strand DNA-binding protein